MTARVLARPGGPSTQEVPAGEDADREPLDQPLVADEAGGDGLGEARDGGEGIGDPLVVERHAVLPIDLTGRREWHASRTVASRGGLRL